MQAKAPLDDREIINLYLRRDERAITETDIKYRNYLLSIAKNILHDPLDCEECLNDTYLNAWNHIPPTVPLFLQSFLKTVMCRIAMDRYKAEHRKKRIPSELTVSLSELQEVIFDDNHPQKYVDDQLLKKIIADFVRSLPKRQMYIFMSRYYMARPVKEIAARLDCSLSTINKEIAKIKTKLKTTLNKEGFLC